MNAIFALAAHTNIHKYIHIHAYTDIHIHISIHAYLKHTQE